MVRISKCLILLLGGGGYGLGFFHLIQAIAV